MDVCLRLPNLANVPILMFKPNLIQNRPDKVPWLNKQFTRDLSDTSCVCGTEYQGRKMGEQGWSVFVHITLKKKIPKKDKKPKLKTWYRVCLGTIINSNMVLTSQQCLMKGSILNVSILDAWHITKRAKGSAISPFAKELEIKVSTQQNFKNIAKVNDREFVVKKLIYRGHYNDYKGILGRLNQTELNVAVVVVDYDFTQDDRLYPICVPKENDLPTHRILNRKGYYEGVRAWDKFKFQFYSGIFQYSYIKLAQDCYRIGELSLKPRYNASLCLSFVLPGPTIEGGALRIIVGNSGGTKEDPWRSYLVGIASWMDSSLSHAAHKYVYFININSIIKQLEYESTMYKSKWCSTPKPFD